MDFIFNALFTVLAHSIGVYVMGLLTGGRFKGESFFAWYWAIIVGCVVLAAPFLAFTAWLSW